MIDNLRELNEVINAVANRALDIVAEQTTSGQLYINHNDVADLISKEDFEKYADLIADELTGRPEVLDPVTLDDGELDINMGPAYCKNYEWCPGDEVVFGCSYDEWLTLKVEPISHPISISRMAEIGHNAIAHIMNTSELSAEELMDSVGMTKAEASVITGIPMEAQEPTAQYESPRNTVLFYLNYSSAEHPLTFEDFESALEGYKKVPLFNEKSISFISYDNDSKGSGAILLMNTGHGIDRPCGIGKEALENPHIALAHSKAIISCYPFDENAWAMRDDAEKKLGITDREVDISKDLYVSNWRVHVVPTGGRYGLHNTVINEKEPLVEFYDMNHIDPKYSPHGLYTGAQYNVNDLLRTYLLRTGANPSALRLDMECPEWTVSAKDMEKVIGYLKDFIQQKTVKPSLNDKIGKAEAKKDGLSGKQHFASAPER